MHRWLIALRRFILHRWMRYVLCWLFAFVLSALELHVAWHMFDNPQPYDPKTARRDGNKGHALIDFGGQWLIANMLAIGKGRELYNREVQKKVIAGAFPRSNEAPATPDKKHDVDNLMDWTMALEPTASDATPIGGPLYPPTHALMFAPLGRLPPQRAYRVAQCRS